MLNEILSNLNREYLIPVDDILNWYPGDFVFDTKRCGCKEYHQCVSKEYQWQDVLERVRAEDRYSKIYKSIKTKGFVVPLAAKVTEDDHVLLLDGHNRVGVGLDLLVEGMPVWIGDSSQQLEDLKSIDSGWWTEAHTPWVTKLGR